MIKVLSQNKIDNYPKKIKCWSCDKELQYDKEDEHVGVDGFLVIKCPCCKEDNPLGEHRVMPPTYPVTFTHWGKGKINIEDIDNKEIQDGIDSVIKQLKENTNSEDCDYGSYICGGLLVIGLKNFDGVEIIVTDNYWSDCINIEDWK